MGGAETPSARKKERDDLALGRDASLPLEGLSRKWNNRWQVFGLAGPAAVGRLRPTNRRFPARARGQCSWRCSFLLTAAGQSRILTGFPLVTLDAFTP